MTGAWAESAGGMRRPAQGTVHPTLHLPARVRPWGRWYQSASNQFVIASVPSPA
jgi:hypothetical protein